MSNLMTGILCVPTLENRESFTGIPEAETYAEPISDLSLRKRWTSSTSSISRQVRTPAS